MSGLNINSPELQALFKKADINKDSVIDANEQKVLSPQELSIFNQYNASKGAEKGPNVIVAGTNFGSVSTGDKAPSVNTSGTGSPTGVTYGDKSDVNQATGDNSKIITTYQELKIDGETAKLLVDAGFTSPEDVKYITGKVKDIDFKNLTPEYQKKVLTEISETTIGITQKGIDNNTAKIMMKAGVGIGKNKEADFKSLDNLVSLNEFQSLSADQQNILLQNVKYPETIRSIVDRHFGAGFDNFEVDKNGTVKMTSTDHGVELSLHTKDNGALRDTHVEHTYGTNQDGRNYENFKIHTSAKSEVIYRDMPDDPNGSRTRSMTISGFDNDRGDQITIKNETKHRMTYRLLEQTDNKCPCKKYVKIQTNNNSEKFPDQVVFKKHYEVRESRFSDGRPTTETVCREKDDREIYNLTAGRLYDITVAANWEDRSKDNPKKQVNDQYIHSVLIGLGNPDKIN